MYGHRGWLSAVPENGSAFRRNRRRGTEARVDRRDCLAPEPNAVLRGACERSVETSSRRRVSKCSLR
jgi:hypothetical protein